MNNLRAYVFLDERRLRMYFEQLAPGHVLIREKTSVWSITVSAIPGIKGNDVVHTRQATLAEVVSEVEDRLESSNRLIQRIDKIESLEMRDIFFVKCILRARRALISADARMATPGLKHLALWLSDSEDSQYSFYLIEACAELEPDHIDCCSGYTALDFILRNLEHEMAAFRRKLLGTYELPSLHDLDANEPFRRFAADPVRYLESMGCQLGPPKNVECLFRVRLLFKDFRRRHGSTGIVGYPLYVSDVGVESC